MSLTCERGGVVRPEGSEHWPSVGKEKERVLTRRKEGRDKAE